MSTLTNFYTYAAMEGAVVYSVSSADADNPADHAVQPLEPNFAWQTDESSTQPTVVIDLTEVRECDGFSFIHDESEDPSPGPALDILVEHSNDAVNWVSIDTACNADGTNDPSDIYDETVRIKLRHFVFDSVLAPFSARYWRFTVIDPYAPSQYAPDNARINALWLFRQHSLDVSASFPVDDTISFPVGTVELLNGKLYRTGYSVNAQTSFSKTWLLNETQYATLMTALEACNGTYRPMVLVDYNNVRRLCKFDSPEISENRIDTGIYYVSCSFVEIPIIRKSAYH